MAKFIRIFCVAGLGLLLLFLFSCEQKHEPAPPPPQVKVVKKSIDLSKRSGQSEKSAPSPSTTLPVNKKADPAVGSTPKTKSAQPSGPVPAADQKTEKDIVGTPSPAGAVSPLQTDSDTAEGSIVKPLTMVKYDTKGRIDPFIPLLSEKKEAPVVAEPEEEKPKRILTPLEKMELSQIKLVAVVELKGRFTAMVEEASGKGYPVEIGTYMGRNGGQVSSITRDGIVVKEYVKDFKGNRRERIQEIKFHKDEGGE